ncbi:ras guanine nucleotide exchange factor domain-containing protein [Suillus occidentalis]|nr:ras guanine nucleotide exchange factor domain-containing protein [Suillus occidentalis]
MLSLNTPQFDIERTFAAILDPIRLFREAADAQDFSLIRSLHRTVVDNLTTVIRSMSRLPKDLLDDKEFEPDCRRQYIQQNLQSLHAVMSSLKGLMQVAEREMRQLKPLPDLPEECEEDAGLETAEGNTDQPHEASRTSLLSGDTRQSNEGLSTERTCVEEASNELGALVEPQAIRRSKRGLTAILKSLSVSLRRKISQPFLKAENAAPVEKLTTRTELFDGKLENALPHLDDSTELFFNRNGVLQLASLKGLVRDLTSAASDDDLELPDVFFLCFRYFSTPALVLEAFIERYREYLPDCLSPDQASIQTMYVKMRVARLLNQWVDLHWRHSEDQEVFSPLLQFAFSDLSRDLPRKVSSKLIETLHSAACSKEHKGRRIEKMVQLIQGSLPAEELRSPWEPRDKKAMVKGEFANIELSNFNSPQGMELLTHQLTALLWEKYQGFQPEDAARFWVKEATAKSTCVVSTDAGTKVTTYASFEKALHLWALDIIVSSQSMEDRIQKQCHVISNYADSWALFFACDRQSLVGSLLNIDARHEEILVALRLFFSHTNRMKAYKDAIQSGQGPTLPTLVLFVGDIKRQCGDRESVDQPNVPGHELVNLRRYQPSHSSYQRCHAPYYIQRVDYVCQWMKEVICSYLNRPEAEWEDILYEKSRSASREEDQPGNVVSMSSDNNIRLSFRCFAIAQFSSQFFIDWLIIQHIID